MRPELRVLGPWVLRSWDRCAVSCRCALQGPVDAPSGVLHVLYLRLHAAAFHSASCSFSVHQAARRHQPNSRAPRDKQRCLSCSRPPPPTCETRCVQGYQSGDPSGQGKAYLKGQQFHWLHHHYFECNCTCQQLDPSHSQRSKEAAFCRRRLRPRAVRSHLRDVPQRQPGNRAGGGALRRSAGGAQGRRRQGQSGVSVVPPRPVFVFAQTVACCTPRTCCCPAQQCDRRRGDCKPAERDLRAWDRGQAPARAARRSVPSLRSNGRRPMGLPHGWEGGGGGSAGWRMGCRGVWWAALAFVSE